MSSLEWIEAPHTNFAKPPVLTIYWELWVVGEDRTAWYNFPQAHIRKIKDRQWELSMPDAVEGEVRYFTTLKAAKAMGIVLFQMEN